MVRQEHRQGIVTPFPLIRHKRSALRIVQLCEPVSSSTLQSLLVHPEEQIYGLTYLNFPERYKLVKQKLNLQTTKREKMKKILLAIFILLSVIVNGQITLEKTYDASGTFVNLLNSGDKFYIMDVVNNQCLIYNTDHTLWKTISLPVPVNNYLYDIRFLSEGLFTTTNELCLAYVYYAYDVSNEYYIFNAKVIKENGTVLLTIPDCQYMSAFSTENNAVKLLTYSYDYSIALYTITTRVYNLPGIITSIEEPQVPTGKVNLSPAFPNPASSFIKIPYSLPEGAESGVLKISDVNGKLITTRQLFNTADNITVQLNDYPAGIYIYSIEPGKSTSGGVSPFTPQTGKILVQ